MDKKVSPGIYFAFITAVISGFANYFSVVAIKIVANPYIFTTVKNVLVGLALCLIFVLIKNREEIKKLKIRDWLVLILIGLIGGSIPFLLFFKGLSLSTPVLGGFIHKSLFIWVSILAIIFLREKLGKVQWLALALLILGNYFLGAFKAFKFQQGEMLILIAVILWAIEFVIAKKILSRISPQVVSWARMFIGSIFLITYLFATKQSAGILHLTPLAILWTVLMSVFLFGYVFFWYRALKFAPASVVSSVLVIGSPITTILSIFFVHGYKFSSSGIYGLILILAGVSIFLAFQPRNQLTKRSPAPC